MSTHEIAQLAQTRRDNPDAAMAIATEAGKAHDAWLSRQSVTQTQETVRVASR